MTNFNQVVSNFVNYNANNTRIKNGALQGMRAKGSFVDEAPFLASMKEDTNYTYTENGGITHKTTNSALLDMFAMGASMRNRSDADVINMFKKAYQENPTYALKCLFYIRDCRGGAGERRFFRVCIKWLASYDKAAVLRNLEYIPFYGRFDDFLCLLDSCVEKETMEIIKKQLTMDMKAYNIKNGAVSLAAKWMPSANASSKETKRYAQKIITALGCTERQYRKMLSALRARINVLERLMSQNRWNEIDFSGIPSRAGIIYKQAFMKHQEERYSNFMSSKETRVNANVLNPVDIAHQIFNNYHPTTVERQAWEKYWGSLKDYYCGKEEPGIAIVDVSGSMSGVPMEAAVSMGAYIAERGKGPFRNHFITFSGNPELVEFEGVDLYDKFHCAQKANWGGSTNIEAVFDLLLNTALKHYTKPKDMPKTLYIFSDMEFNTCVTCGAISYSRWSGGHVLNRDGIDTVIETQAKKWARHGYKIPRVIFWNLDARQDNIPAIGDGFSYVSGFSMNMVECILSGKDGYDLMMAKLDSERYKDIQ